MERNEALEAAEKLKQNRQSEDIINLLQPFYLQKKTIDIACYLIYAYRRLGDYETCYRICNEIEAVSGNSKRIALQRKWIRFFDEVVDCDSKVQKLLRAEILMDELDIANNYEFSIAKYLCFYIARTFEHNDPQKAINWLERINPYRLSNKVRYFVIDDESSYDNDSRRVHSEKMIYYLNLIGLLRNSKMLQSWIKNSLSNYTSNATTSIMVSINNHISYSDGNINLRRLARILMILTEDLTIMQSAVSTDLKGLIISDVSNFVFCPVSFSIKKSIFPVESLTSLDYDEETSFHRKYLNDLYEIYNNNNKSFAKAFDKIIKEGFVFSKSDMEILHRIFNSKRIGQNTSGSNFMNYYFQKDDISGSPDMYLEDTQKYLVEEVYTDKSLSEFTSPYENDLIKITGYLVEMNLNFGYLFYWNTERKKVGKEIFSIICGVKIFKIEKGKHMVDKYLHEKSLVKEFLQTGYYNFPSTRINHNKCINCSVVFYCLHKKGFLNSIALPYKENYLSI